MSRNRKRAKERRARRPSGATVGRHGTATARAQDLDASRAEELETSRAEELETSQADELDPSRAEELDVSLEAARSDELDGPPNPIEHANPDVELADAQIALGRSASIDQAEAEREEDLLEEEIEEQRDERAVPAVVRERAGLGTRLAGFLQGSWRELQRVQWPDRRQVVQATGVVIGFVIVAGVFLGVADLLSQKLINFILK